MRLLLIEDDLALGEGIDQALGREGYTVDWIRDGSSALHALLSETFDLAVLDLGLPRMDGLEVLRRLRDSGSNLPVLILTARDALPERLAGLNGGADDYLCKPFALDEVAVRLAVLVRRSQGRAAAILSYGSLSLDTAAKTATLQEKPLVLTQREYMLLELLLSQPTHIHSRAQIEDKLYGWSQEVESNAVEVHIHHLRKKIGSTFIQTQRGLGYRLGQQP